MKRVTRIMTGFRFYFGMGVLVLLAGGFVLGQELEVVIPEVTSGESTEEEFVPPLLRRPGTEMTSSLERLLDRVKGPEVMDKGQSDIDLRIEAVRIFGKMGAEKSLPAVPYLIQELNEANSSDVRIELAKVLGQFGAVTEDVVPGLIRALNVQHWGVQNAVIQALARIGPPAKEALSTLIPQLANQVTEVRHESLKAIAAIGVAAPEVALPHVYRGLEEKDLGMQMAALQGLEKYPAVVVDWRRLVGVLESAPARSASYANRIFPRFVPKEEASVTVLTEMLTSPSRWSRQAALASLKQMPELGKPALSSLASLESSDPLPLIRAQARETRDRIALASGSTSKKGGN